MINKTNFTSDGFCWELTNSGYFFGDKEVTIIITTGVDTDEPVKEIYNEQIETLNIVLQSWGELLAIIEQEILDYEGMAKQDLFEVANSPKICLDVDYMTNEPFENNKWSFVLGVNKSEDFGWHVEFEGKTHLDTWAG